MKDLMVKAWGFVPDKKLVLTVTLVVCVVLVSIGGVLAGVKIPFKGKTAVELGLETYWENWRLHSNTGKLMVAEKKSDRLRAECIRIERLLSDLQLARWQLMGVPGMPASQREIELEMSGVKIEHEKKSLVVVQLALVKATHSYDTLWAQR